MKTQYSRREILKTVAAVSATAFFPRATCAIDREIEIQITSPSENTLRLTLLPVRSGTVSAVPNDGSLLRTDWGPPAAILRGALTDHSVKCRRFSVQVNTNPVSFTITDTHDVVLQRMRFDAQSGSLSFITGDGHLLGLGEGGPQFDRRGSIDEMRSGQGAYKLQTHGGRVPIPWIIGTEGWGMFFHHPFGRLDFTAAESKFLPSDSDHVLPLDIFFISAENPETIMAEYARLTDYPEMPPLWAFGHQQSHRTLGSRFSQYRPLDNDY
jgi:hypothetical protein